MIPFFNSQNQVQQCHYNSPVFLQQQQPRAVQSNSHSNQYFSPSFSQNTHNNSQSINRYPHSYILPSSHEVTRSSQLPPFISTPFHSNSFQQASQQNHFLQQKQQIHQIKQQQQQFEQKEKKQHFNKKYLPLSLLQTQYDQQMPSSNYHQQKLSLLSYDNLCNQQNRDNEKSSNIQVECLELKRSVNKNQSDFLKNDIFSLRFGVESLNQPPNLNSSNLDLLLQQQQSQQPQQSVSLKYSDLQTKSNDIKTINTEQKSNKNSGIDYQSQQQQQQSPKKQEELNQSATDVIKNINLYHSVISNSKNKKNTFTNSSIFESNYQIDSERKENNQSHKCYTERSKSQLDEQRFNLKKVIQCNTERFIQNEKNPEEYLKEVINKPSQFGKHSLFKAPSQFQEQQDLQNKKKSIGDKKKLLKRTQSSCSSQHQISSNQKVLNSSHSEKQQEQNLISNFEVSNSTSNNNKQEDQIDNHTNSNVKQYQVQQQQQYQNQLKKEQEQVQQQKSKIQSQQKKLENKVNVKFVKNKQIERNSKLSYFNANSLSQNLKLKQESNLSSQNSEYNNNSSSQMMTKTKCTTESEQTIICSNDKDCIIFDIRQEMTELIKQSSRQQQQQKQLEFLQKNKFVKSTHQNKFEQQSEFDSSFIQQLSEFIPQKNKGNESIETFKKCPYLPISQIQVYDLPEYNIHLLISNKNKDISQKHNKQNYYTNSNELAI